MRGGLLSDQEAHSPEQVAWTHLQFLLTLFFGQRIIEDLNPIICIVCFNLTITNKQVGVPSHTRLQFLMPQRNPNPIICVVCFNLAITNKQTKML